MLELPLIFRIVMISVALLFFWVTLYLVRNDKGEVRHMKLWLIISIVLLVISIYPKFLVMISVAIGFHAFSNFLMFTAIALLLFIVLSQHIKIIEHEKNIKMLIQEISITNKKKDDETEE